MGKDYWTLVGPNRGAAIIFTHLDFHSQRGQALWVRSRTTGPEHSNCHELDWMCAERYQKRKSDLVILITIADSQFLGAVSWHNGCFHYLFFYFGGEGWMKRVYFSWQLIAHLPWKSKQELRARTETQTMEEHCLHWVDGAACFLIQQRTTWVGGATQPTCFHYLGRSRIALKGLRRHSSVPLHSREANISIL